MQKLLEIACFDSDSAVRAAEAGADRIELCFDYNTGGLTPPPEWLPQIKAAVTVPVYVMLRPRAGDFFYTNAEFGAMQAALVQFRQLGADGFVFGLLRPEGGIDAERCAELLAQASPLPCTFHRAFDQLGSLSAALDGLETLVSLGFSTLLSSGLAPTAMEGSAVLAALMAQAAGRIVVMPGGAIRSGNIAALDALAGAGFYHSAALSARPGTGVDAAEVRRLKISLQQQTHTDWQAQA